MRPKRTFAKVTKKYGFDEFNPDVTERMRLGKYANKLDKRPATQRNVLLKAFSRDLDLRVVRDKNDVEIAKEAASTLRMLSEGDTALVRFFTLRNVLKILKKKREQFRANPRLFAKKVEEQYRKKLF